MHVHHRRFMAALALLLPIALVGCQSLGGGSDAALEASGVVEAVEVRMSPEFGGRVVELLAEEGDAVSAGQALVRLDDSYLQAQRQQAQAAFEAAQAQQASAQAALDSAQASLQAAQAGVAAAQAQLDIERALARAQDLPARVQAWAFQPPAAFDLPNWYFSDEENLDAAKDAVEKAEQELQEAQEGLQNAVPESLRADLIKAEGRLAQAREAFRIAEDLRARVVVGPERREVRDAVQDWYDEAVDELDAAQKAYDELLTDEEADAVIAARARIATAEERYQAAQANYESHLTGEHALSVTAAQAMLESAQANAAYSQALVEQARAGVQQAEQGLQSAQSSLELLDLQIEKMTLYAPVDGVVLTRAAEIGELLAPGGVALTIGRLDDLKVMIYISEDQYGRIKLGDAAEVRVDSFPEETFTARVTRIADQAEYTPRNVQTKEERQTTVFAVELSVTDGHGMLKPGMPADVRFVVK